MDVQNIRNYSDKTASSFWCEQCVCVCGGRWVAVVKADVATWSYRGG